MSVTAAFSPSSLGGREKGGRLSPVGRDAGLTFIADALKRLARDDPMAAELDSEQAQAKDPGRAAQETCLRDMVRQGNTIDAVIVAKDLYGFTTTEAKRFLDELECHQLCLLSEGMQMRRRHDRGVRCLLPERDIQDLR